MMKAGYIPSRVKNKMRISTFISSIQHCTGSSSQSDLARKRKTGIWVGKAKIKLFADEMIL